MSCTEGIKNSFPYIGIGGEARVFLHSDYLWSAGDVLSRPVLGIGYRMQKNHLGLDSSISFSPLLLGSGIRIEAAFIYNYFFIPNLSSQLYTGVGLGFCGLFNGIVLELGLPAPKFVLGKQYSNSFLEIQIDPGYLIVPGIIFRYGIGF